MAEVIFSAQISNCFNLKKIKNHSLKQKQNSMMSPDEEVAMIMSSDRDDGPTTCKRAKIMTNNKAGSSQDDGECSRQSPSQTRTIGSNRCPWDESSDSDSSQSSLETGPKGSCPLNLRLVTPYLPNT